MRLTGFSKLIIALAVAAGVFFLIRTFLPDLGKQKTANETEQTISTDEETEGGGVSSDDTPPTNEGKTTTNKAKKKGGSTFFYTPEVPKGGDTYGVVEMGAEGFNYFIVKIDKSLNWEMTNAVWGSSFVKDGLATPANIREKLTEAIRDMLNKYGVSGKKIHFVISSGAAKEAITKDIKAELSKLGYIINIVTPEKEGIYAYKAIVPQPFRENSFMVDIGSGNTKIAFMKGGKFQSIESYGAKYFQNNVADETVKNEVIAKVKQVPSELRTSCFMVGGTPFSLAKKTRTDENERYTVLENPADYKPDGAKEKAGLNIYSGLVEGSDCDNFVFDWKGNFTIGFLLEMHEKQGSR